MTNETTNTAGIPQEKFNFLFGESVVPMPQIPTVAPSETKIWGAGLFGEKPELTDEQLEEIAKAREVVDRKLANEERLKKEFTIDFNESSVDIIRQVVRQFVVDNTWGHASNLSEDAVDQIKLAFADVLSDVTELRMMNED
tara:strand:- start:425 stop:847 length:423 start_codon:yes stop_codon:yes gene_type:complete